MAYLTVSQAVKSHTHTHIHTVDVSFPLSCALRSTVCSLLRSPCILHSELELTSITVNPSSHPPTPTRHDHEKVNHRSFSYQGPVVWNSLPTDLKLSSSLSSFKSKLKTLLFKKSNYLCSDNCHRCYWSYHNDKKHIDVVRS